MKFMPEESVSFSIEGVERRGDKIEVMMVGTATSITPEFVIKTRAKLKALRVVGIESLAREMWDDVASGEINRVTRVSLMERVDGDKATDVWEIAVDVSTR